MEVNHDAPPATEDDDECESWYSALEIQPEIVQLEQLSHVQPGSEQVYTFSNSGRYGSHQQSYSREAFDGSLEVDVSQELRQYQYKRPSIRRKEFWRNQQGRAESNIRYFEYLVSEEQRLPKHLETLIVIGTIKTVWRDLANDALMPFTYENMPSAKDLQRSMRSRFVFCDKIRCDEPTETRRQAYPDLCKLYTEQKKNYRQELNASIKFFSTFFGRVKNGEAQFENGEAQIKNGEAQHPFIISYENLRDSLWTVDGNLNALLANCVAKVFAAGMNTLDNDQLPSHWRSLQGKPTLIQISSWDDRYFVEELAQWLDTETRKRGREVFEELILMIARESQTVSQTGV